MLCNKQFKPLYLLCSFFYTQSLFCNFVPEYFAGIPPAEEPAPWFTGPLLAPSANTIPPGHANIEPYAYCIISSASYNSNWGKASHSNVYSCISQWVIQVGITSFMDIQVIPQLFYTFTQNIGSAQIGDLITIADFQITKDHPDHWIPSITLGLFTTFPTGNYQHLDPRSLGVDGAGSGSWNPALLIKCSKMIPCSQDHFCNVRLFLKYGTFTPVSVKGFNVYGGGFDTNGTVYPGNTFTCDIAFEYNLSKNWNFAMDLLFVHQNKTRFSGNPGLLANMKSPSSEQLSLAPAIEYSWSKNMGIITGVWFTMGGRNADCFWSPMSAINIYF